MTHTITLHTPAQAETIFERARAWILGRVKDGKPVTLTLDEDRRTSEQNALLHALLTDISRRREWAGARQDVETWKRLFTAAWCRARGEAVRILPAIDGQGIDIVFRRTSKMSRAELSELIEYVQAWDAA